MAELLVFAVAIVAAAIAAVTGFGIGSLLTPALAIAMDTRLAVAAVAIPHFVGTAQRFWMLRQYVDRQVLLGFGIASAAGGLVGALLHSRVPGRPLAIVFGMLLLVASASELTGWIQRRRWSRPAAWVAGALSGAFGGLVGNQGGIRSAALLGFEVPKRSFVATATAIALFVDGARLPVYLFTQGRDIGQVWNLVLPAVAGVVVGTAIGRRTLDRIPDRGFRVTVAWVLAALGAYMLLAGGW